MGRPFILYYDEIPSYNCIHCCICRTRVAFIKDYIPNVNDLLSGGYFSRVFNVEVPEEERYHQVVDGKTLADTYCNQCGMLLGWKLIAISQPSKYYREGKFYMRLNKLIYWNDLTLLSFLLGGDHEQTPINKMLIKDGDANKQIPNEQNLGDNEQNADQDGQSQRTNS
ncbi:unnamed protein product [Withania somnifera]